MAQASMGYTHVAATAAPEILWNSEYTGAAVTLDTAAFSDGVCKAGTPIGADGAVANSASALGILLVDVHEERPQGTVVIGGYINTKVAQEHSGVTLSAEAKTALKNVVFMNVPA